MYLFTVVLTQLVLIYFGSQLKLNRMLGNCKHCKKPHIQSNPPWAKLGRSAEHMCLFRGYPHRIPASAGTTQGSPQSAIETVEMIQSPNRLFACSGNKTGANRSLSRFSRDRTPDCSGHRRTSPGGLWSGVGNAGPHPGGSGADWATPGLTSQKVCQKICQKYVRQECQKICQKKCQKICQ